jgi:hypothetical protein
VKPDPRVLSETYTTSQCSILHPVINLKAHSLSQMKYQHGRKSAVSDTSGPHPNAIQADEEAGYVVEDAVPYLTKIRLLVR